MFSELLAAPAVMPSAPIVCRGLVRRLATAVACTALVTFGAMQMTMADTSDPLRTRVVTVPGTTIATTTTTRGG